MHLFSGFFPLNYYAIMQLLNVNIVQKYRVYKLDNHHNASSPLAPVYSGGMMKAFQVAAKFKQRHYHGTLPNCLH